MPRQRDIDTRLKLAEVAVKALRQQKKVEEEMEKLRELKKQRRDETRNTRRNQNFSR